MGLVIAIRICSHKKPAEDRVHTGKDLLGKAAEMHTETHWTRTALV